MFLTYEWPGNVRELENMIKRFVILQDESMVVRELTKPRPVMHPSAYHEPAVAAVHAMPPAHASVAPPTSPVGMPEPDDDDDGGDEVPVAAAPAAADGRRLADVAREAALAAERVAISDTLRQVHWNRRKAAQILGVSYKTLLNKIKETGIERP
jgi:DNA-binding NtrC family response regulator